ncbi:MAG: hypothetical protein SPK87_05425, partial [Bacteroidales bacterium]|nr:hypothetical protein [Bacteroidales bacterium]
ALPHRDTTQWLEEEEAAGCKEYYGRMLPLLTIFLSTVKFSEFLTETKESVKKMVSPFQVFFRRHV